MHGSIHAAGEFLDEYHERFIAGIPEGERFEDQVTTFFGLTAQRYLRLGLPDLAVEPIAQQRARIGPKDTRQWGNNCQFRANLALARDDLAALKELAAETRDDPRMEQRVGGPFDGQIEIRLAMAEISAAARGELPQGSGRSRMQTWANAKHILKNVRQRAVLWIVQSLLDEAATTTTTEAAKQLRASGQQWLDRSAELLAPARGGSSSATTLMLDVQETRLAVAKVATLDQTSAAKLWAERDAAFRRLMRRWHDTGTRDGGVGFLFFEDARSLLSELIELSCAVHGEDTGAILVLERILEAQSFGSLARALGAKAITLDYARKTLLTNDRGALLYVPGRTRSHLFAIDANAVSHVRLPAKHTLNGLRNACNVAVGRVLREDSKAASDALEKALAKAAVTFLPEALHTRLDGWSEIALVGIESLGQMPFELLPTAGQRFGARHVVSYLPSFPVGAALVERRTARPASEPDAPGSMLLCGPRVSTISIVSYGPTSLICPSATRNKTRCSLHTRRTSSRSPLDPTMRERSCRRAPSPH